MNDDKAAQIAGFQAAEIAKFADARAKMNDEEKEAEIASVRNQLGILPRKPPDVKMLDVDEGPYEVDTTEETYMIEKAAAHTPEDTMTSATTTTTKTRKTKTPCTLRQRGAGM